MNPVAILEMFTFLKGNEALQPLCEAACVAGVTLNSEKTRMSIELIVNGGGETRGGGAQDGAANDDGATNDDGVHEGAANDDGVQDGAANVSATQSEIALLEQLIADEYGMETVTINATGNIVITGEPDVKPATVESTAAGSAAAESAAAETTEATETTPSGTVAAKPASAARAKTAPALTGNKKPSKPSVPDRGKTPKRAIMGRINQVMPKPMCDVTIDDGRVTVRGYVCDVKSKYIEKSRSVLLSFDITDYTNTLNVSKFMDNNTSRKMLDSVKKGMYLTVAGTLRINNRDGEMTLTPVNIFESEAAVREDNAPEKRVELHLHTQMSALDGITGISDVIKRAAKWGHRALAITDHGVVHAFPEAAIEAGKAEKATGHKVKIIYGVEGYLLNDKPGALDTLKISAAFHTAGTDDLLDFPDEHDTQDEAGNAVISEISQVQTPNENSPLKGQVYHIILLAKDRTGLKNLYELISISHTEHFYKRPLICKSVLNKHREGLIVGSACESGELFQAIIKNKDEKTIADIARYYDYLEIQPLCNNMFMTYGQKPIAKNKQQLRDFNKKIVDIGKALDIPVVATTDSHFLDPEDEIYRKIILSAKKFENADEELPLYFRTTEEMLEELSYLGDELAYELAVTNTNKIADMCQNITPLPPERRLYPPRLDGSDRELKEIIERRLPELYGDNPPEIITKRVEDELRDILGLSYDVIYMAAQKLVAFLRSEGSRVGSRGSVGSSFVAFLSGVSEVNPLPAHYRCSHCRTAEFPEDSNMYACGPDMPDKTCPGCGGAYIKDGFTIPFETFLGFCGEKIPDIDLNISGEHSKSAQKFIYDMFGKENVFRAGTIGKVKDKTAYGFVRKYLEAKELSVSRAEENRLIEGCSGVKQTTSQHPGGLIVIPQDKEVTDFCPVQYPADDSEKKIITTHFDYKKMEDYLLKLDMLGHDNPTMLVALENMTGINSDDLRLDDPDTMSIFSSPLRLNLPDDDEIIGKTGAIGIPEFGTVPARQMLFETKPDNFDMLIRLSGYSHGEMVWSGNARELIASGTATVAETISSRDDIMLYLISMGMDSRQAFAISESVRKGKGLPGDSEARMYSLGVPGWYVESCKKISYLFPRAHATAYVLMAFRIAWFKVHRPIEYYSTHFYRRRKNGAFDAELMTRGIDTVRSKIRDMKKLAEGKGKLPKKEEELLASLESCYEFYLRGFDFADIDFQKSDAKKFLPVSCDDGRQLLQPPFIAVSGLGEKAAQALAEFRDSRQVASIEEVAACPGINKSHIAELTRLGAFADLPESSQMSLF